MSTVPVSSSLGAQVQQILGVPLPQADEIVETFDRIVAQPLQRNLAKKKGRELAQRNPMIYTVRGVLDGIRVGRACPSGLGDLRSRRTPRNVA